MTRKSLPALPSKMFSNLGPLKVTRQSVGEDEARGEVNLHERTVWIGLDLPPVMEWQAFFHEMVHVALFDSGVHYHLPMKVEESICDAMGHYLAAAMRAGFLKVEPK